MEMIKSILLKTEMRLREKMILACTNITPINLLTCGGEI